MAVRLACVGVAAILPQAVSALPFESREAADCVALHAALGPERPDAPPTEIAALDAEALAYRAAAIRLAGGNAAEVDARVRERARSLSSLRMSLNAPDATEEEGKEMERARLGSLCNDLGERLPETRPFFLRDEADR
ncbi:MAG: hypothetical protein H6895_12475 [Defluviimonas sp.]|uniref:hypothetical protein n=1 Tax=Albidovulum sp. TaxID=1872424 RepID=UPI001D9CF8A6|nr:hypothetical protein [Paracoccaceae bacterium]MCC0064886.1 hypothetical protein [Defluviimonas sp.]